LVGVRNGNWQDVSGDKEKSERRVSRPGDPPGIMNDLVESEKITKQIPIPYYFPHYYAPSSPKNVWEKEEGNVSSAFNFIDQHFISLRSRLLDIKSEDKIQSIFPDVSFSSLPSVRVPPCGFPRERARQIAFTLWKFVLCWLAR